MQSFFFLFLFSGASYKIINDNNYNNDNNNNNNDNNKINNDNDNNNNCNKLFAELNGKPKKVMIKVECFGVMQIKVECFGVAYAVKVKNKRT